MNKRADAVQYTIRGIPREVDRILRRRAARTKTSLNQVVLEELERATVGETRRAKFIDLAGKWEEDPGFDRVIASTRRIDKRKWK